MKKRYSYRAYPTGGQQQSLARLFGCVRVVFNDVIEARETAYREKTGFISAGELQKRLITQAKKTPEREWLAEVSNVPLQQSVRDADRAYRNFFDSISGKRKGPKVGKPRFKSRRDHRQSARFTRGVFDVRQTSKRKAQVRLSKIGWVTFHLSRPLPSDPSSVTIIHSSDGTYHVSFVVDVPPKPGPVSTTAAGVDLGLTDVAAIACSDGTREKITNPRTTKTYERRLARAAKLLARKQKGSNNWHKQRTKVARIHSRIRNTRHDHAHKLARRLIDENQVIAVEDLNVAGLARAGAKGKRGRGMRKSVHDAGWAMLIRLLQEKGTEAGRQVVLVNPAYTSQTCAVCGVLDGPKLLDVREWTCTECTTQLDRDYNAAVNIMTGAGHALSACGVDVRRPLASA
ncbi:MAG TPA: RNA-guided endonuclease TnpB family protein, partial [Beutenbergiaceae bacterium]|nr:RNA-guided endonuclease TnpB family protein [Beutenbergiaceae bacterium]